MSVDTFTLYVAVRADRPLDEATLSPLVTALGPGGDEHRVWLDGADRALVRVSVDSEAENLDAALQKAHLLAGRARALVSSGARVIEVSAMTDHDVMVWRAEP
ncbi:hypothetical protein [Blastococcus sp. PRF04-17]|uniref:hypothetical protein n=1 Tax=Blastococcus sp. PRF04-17 TaxID=2933797 RepID=UPI001FF29D34|nr:hypothetical protein [Blastococcus sp. PRF04-17]UOY01115.1 hypothetical protein MVA48_19485 [Blastococcus sp. PRF04-17]